MSRKKIGTLTLLRERAYAIKPSDDIEDPNTVVAALAPGDYPVYQDPDGKVYWEGEGIPSRFVNATTTRSLPGMEGAFSLHPAYYHKPTGDPAVTVQSGRYASFEVFQAELATQVMRERMRFRADPAPDGGAHRRIFNEIDALMSKFLYYDRKESDLSMEALNQAVETGAVTVTGMVAEFERHLRATYPDSP